jgi:hypothetical protein
MKKVKIISALMAAVLAAVPVTGVTGSVFGNEIAHYQMTAFAGSNVPYGDSSQNVTTTTGNKWFDADDSKAILKSKNGKYGLYLQKNGALVIKKNGKVVKTVFDIKNPIKPGFPREPLVLYMQEDGNLVVYSKINGRLDVKAHSNTWMYSKVKEKVYFEYELTDEGALQIRRHFLTGQYAGKSDIVRKF